MSQIQVNRPDGTSLVIYLPDRMPSDPAFGAFIQGQQQLQLLGEIATALWAIQDRMAKPAPRHKRRDPDSPS